MALAYKKPGVSIDELVNPTFQPFLGDPTSIVIVGPARGYEAKTDTVQLLDSIPAVLSVDDGIDITSLTVTSEDGATTYTQGTATGTVGGDADGTPNGDYYVNGNEVIRSMSTRIEDDEPVVIYYEINADAGGNLGYQEEITLDLLTSVQLAIGSLGQSTSDTSLHRVAVYSRGEIPKVGAQTNWANSPGDETITVSPGAFSSGYYFDGTTFGMTVWVDYTDDDGVRHYNEALTFAGATSADLDNATNSDADVANIVIRNVNDTTATDTSIRYGATSPSSTAVDQNGADYVITRSGSNPYTFSLARADLNSSDITSGQTVRVSYVATPADYYLPTQVFSQADVEDKYGPALDSSGNVLSPVTLAAGFAFANGATDMVIQALFHENDDGTLSPGGTDTSGSSDTLNLADWTATLENLRDVNGVNVVVPLVSTGSGNYSDTLSINVFLAVAAHIRYMISNADEYLVAICGEDSTVLGANDVAMASAATLQAHAATLQATALPEIVTLIAPGGYQYASPIGSSTDIGGQYVAAMVAGRLASQDIAQTLTRRTLIGLTAVKDVRSEREKDSDAQSGLFVIESKRGVIQVRHAITVAVNNSNTRELSVIRAKGYMVENVKAVIDEQIIGQIIADDRAAFTIQTLIESELDSLVTEGAIVSYQDVQARLLESEPTTIEVRFSYLPAFPLNYVNIKFSINTASGVVSTTDNTQGL